MAGPKKPKPVSRTELSKQYEEAKAERDAAVKENALGDTPAPLAPGAQVGAPSGVESAAGGAPEEEGSSDPVQVILETLPQGKELQAERLAAIQKLSQEQLATLVFGLDRYAEFMASQWALASRVIWQLLIVCLEVTGGKMPQVTPASDVKTIPGPPVPFRAMKAGGGPKLAIGSSAQVDAMLEAAKRRGTGPKLVQ